MHKLIRKPIILSMCLSLCFSAQVHRGYKTLPNSLTWTEDCRPRSKTPGVNLCVKADVQIENTDILHLNFKHKGKSPLCSNFDARELLLVKYFRVFVITSSCVLVVNWAFGRILLLCLLYLPIPTT